MKPYIEFLKLLLGLSTFIQIYRILTLSKPDFSIYFMAVNTCIKKKLDKIVESLGCFVCWICALMLYSLLFKEKSLTFNSSINFPFHILPLCSGKHAVLYLGLRTKVRMLEESHVRPSCK